LVHDDGEPQLTYSGIGVFRRELLDGWRETVGNASGADTKPPRFKLRPMLEKAIAEGKAGGSHHRGTWTDVGTPARLAQLEFELRG
jgi:MurNAc alpha-1-phosphate uridylyltransferase